MWYKPGTCDIYQVNAIIHDGQFSSFFSILLVCDGFELKVVHTVEGPRCVNSCKGLSSLNRCTKVNVEPYDLIW